MNQDIISMNKCMQHFLQRSGRNEYENLYKKAHYLPCQPGIDGISTTELVVFFPSCITQEFNSCYRNESMSLSNKAKLCEVTLTFLQPPSLL